MHDSLIDILAARFPDPYTAPPGEQPLAYGGNLTLPMLIAAYSRGFFPWYNEAYPILWWSPDPRCILLPNDFHISARSARFLKNKPFKLTFDHCFEKVMRECAMPRKGQDGDGWITKDMIEAYVALHNWGYAHSVEAWRDDKLVGGIYGVSLGKAFFGESMFHKENEASRAALAGLIGLLNQEDFIFLDCQQASHHMLRMGAQSIPRVKFLDLLNVALEPGRTCSDIPWKPWKQKYLHQKNHWVKMALVDAK